MKCSTPRPTAIFGRNSRGLTADRRYAIGTGIALLHQGTGLGSAVPDTGAGRLTLLPDGRVEAAFGLDEIGQGLVAAIQATVAAALGCERDDVLAVFGDTARTPNSGSTTAARGTFVVWKGAELLGADFGAQLRRAAAAILERQPEDLAIASGGLRDVRANSDDLSISFAELAARLAPHARPRAECSFEFPRPTIPLAMRALSSPPARRSRALRSTAPPARCAFSISSSTWRRVLSSIRPAISGRSRAAVCRASASR